MIAALIISNFCLMLAVKGVPTWLEIIINIIYIACNMTALILWEETTYRIRFLEYELKIKDEH